MLFNSYIFLFGFLPLSLAIYLVADRWPAARVPVLIALSFVFYGYWDARFIALLALSITINWAIAQYYIRTRHALIITFAIAANLAVLGFFKYWVFALTNLNVLLSLPPPQWEIAMPLGISFFTFHHIMYLVDLRRGVAPDIPFGKYALYICYFPQILAGPLVRWSEILHQFGRSAFAEGWERRWAIGIMLIVLGLAQKTMLGDGLARDVVAAYQRAAQGPLMDGSAWAAVFGFSFQIFFDFAGYSDIAIGLSLLLGLQLPLNFDAPYRALSIRDFWRRWHMTLSRFLRDYLYIPLGGNRYGLPVQVAALIATMTLGGLWHGAGWTFVIWGLLHGLALAFVALWSRVLPAPPIIVGWFLTFGFVCFTWIFFRARTMTEAWNVIQGLAVPPNGNGWRTIAIAAVCAIILPASHVIVARLTDRPRPALAWAIGLAGILVIAQLGREQNFEFIYFQF